MRILLWVVFVLLLALFVFSLTPSFIVLVLVTFGLAAFSNTIFLWFLLLLPAILVAMRPGLGWPAWVAALLLPVVVGIALPLVIGQMPLTAVASRLAGDTPVETRAAPAFIEYTDPAARHTGPPVICDSICQSLLVTDGVERVRLTSLDFVGRPSSVDVVVAEAARCANPMGHVGFATQAIVDLEARGGCITVVPPSADTPAGRVNFALLSPDGPASLLDDPNFLPTVIAGIKQVTASVPGASDIVQTQVQHLLLRTPLMLDFAECDDVCLGLPVLARDSHVVNGFDEAILVRQIFAVPD